MVASLVPASLAALKLSNLEYFLFTYFLILFTIGILSAAISATLPTPFAIGLVTLLQSAFAVSIVSTPTCLNGAIASAIAFPARVCLTPLITSPATPATAPRPDWPARPAALIPPAAADPTLFTPFIVPAPTLVNASYMPLNGFATAAAIFGTPSIFPTAVTPVASDTLVAVLATDLTTLATGFIIACTTPVPVFAAPPTTLDATLAAFPDIPKRLLAPPKIVPGLVIRLSTALNPLAALPKILVPLLAPNPIAICTP